VAPAAQVELAASDVLPSVLERGCSRSEHEAA
jgi:hypothetical protein